MLADQFDKHSSLGDDFWGSDDQFPVEDWQYEVSEDFTRIGYWDWVLIQRNITDTLPTE